MIYTHLHPTLNKTKIISTLFIFLNLFTVTMATKASPNCQENNLSWNIGQLINDWWTVYTKRHFYCAMSWNLIHSAHRWSSFLFGDCCVDIILILWHIYILFNKPFFRKNKNVEPPFKEQVPLSPHNSNLFKMATFMFARWPFWRLCLG